MTRIVTKNMAHLMYIYFTQYIVVDDSTALILRRASIREADLESTSIATRLR
jgi:hypothetical protein